MLYLNRVCTHIRLGMLETGLYVHVCIFVEGMYTCKTGDSRNKGLCSCFFFHRVCTHARLGILAMSLCVYVCVFV